MSEENKTREEKNQIFKTSASEVMAKRNVMKEDFGYEVPVESVPLPSRGRVYHVESPLHGHDTLDIRAMTAQDEDILTSKALIKKGTVISCLLKSCLIDKRIDPNEMIAGDRNAVMTALRITGYGQEYNVEVDCPACSTRSKQAFDLAGLPIKRLSIDPIAEGANSFELRLPMTKKTIRFKFLNGADEEEIMITSERSKKAGLSGENLVTTRLKHAITSIDGVTDKGKIALFIRNMPARDSLAIRRHIDNNEPGIEMKAWMECPNCLESSEVRLPMGATFFWPDAE